MPRPVSAIVTGFTKNPELPALSLAPLRALKRKGVIRRIVAVTWDSPEIDAFVAPVAAMDDVELIRVPQPEATGGRYRAGVVYQLRNLEAALRHVPEPDALVFKTRQDFILDQQFLENKIVNFETLCAPSKLGKQLGVKMPSSPFAMKIWLPWADANTPFFYEDAAFLGLKRDLALLADRAAEKRLDVLADPRCGWFAHVVRFALPFLRGYPMFETYLRNFRHLPNDLKYRNAMLGAMLSDTFYLHLLVVHAWILANAFHVDCGEPGQIAFYPNISNQGADWSSLKSLVVNLPYNDVTVWREGQKPGGLTPCVTRIYGRLMDDDWQTALFASAPRDLSKGRIAEILSNVPLYRRGVYASHEAEFERRLSAVYHQHWSQRAA